MCQVYFVTGIDTNIGKSYATGYLAKAFANKGKKVITQKFIQTGNTGISEDILIHRKIMGIDLLDVDKQKITYPMMFSYPASPHLSAKIDGFEIDLDKIKQSTNILKGMFDIVLIEGAGGIMVPTIGNATTIDYISEEKLDVILVTTPKLGSINHTLLTLDACKKRRIEVKIIAYNEYLAEDDIISTDTRKYLKNYIRLNFPQTEWINIPTINQ